MRPAATNTRRKSVHERPDLDGNWLREAYSWIVESDGQSRHPWELIARRGGLTTDDGDAGRWEQAWAQQLETRHGIRAGRCAAEGRSRGHEGGGSEQQGQGASSAGGVRPR